MPLERDRKVRCCTSQPEITSVLFFVLGVLVQSTYVPGSFCTLVLLLGRSLLQCCEYLYLCADKRACVHIYLQKHRHKGCVGFVDTHVHTQTLKPLICLLRECFQNLVSFKKQVGHLTSGISASGFAKPRSSGRCLLLCAGRGCRLGVASPACRRDALGLVSPSRAKRSPFFPREGSLPCGGWDALLSGSVPIYPPVKLYSRRLQLLPSGSRAAGRRKASQLLPIFPVSAGDEPPRQHTRRVLPGAAAVDRFSRVRTAVCKGSAGIALFACQARSIYAPFIPKKGTRLGPSVVPGEQTSSVVILWDYLARGSALTSSNPFSPCCSPPGRCLSFAFQG